MSIGTILLFMLGGLVFVGIGVAIYAGNTLSGAPASNHSTSSPTAQVSEVPSTEATPSLAPSATESQSANAGETSQTFTEQNG
jgi:hypothetical protein